MRTLKFRVYIPEHEKFSYFELGNFDYSDRYLDQDGYPVQQFTGLLDKNSKEIYEGDLVKFSEEDKPFEVRYCIDSEGVYYGLIDSENSDTGYSLSTDKDLEVVGNIFETKLEKKRQREAEEKIRRENHKVNKDA